MHKIKSAQFEVGVLGGLKYARVPTECREIRPGDLGGVPGFFLYPKSEGHVRFVTAPNVGEIVLEDDSELTAATPGKPRR